MYYQGNVGRVILAGTPLVCWQKENAEHEIKIILPELHFDGRN